MDFHKKIEEKGDSFKRRIKEIEIGKYSFDEVGLHDDKLLLEQLFLEKLENGEITEDAKVALARFECDEIIKGYTTLEDLPKSIKEVITSNENYMNYLKAGLK